MVRLWENRVTRLPSLFRYFTAHLIRFLLYADLTSLIFPLAEESISSCRVRSSSRVTHSWVITGEHSLNKGGGGGGFVKSVDARKKHRFQVLFVACTLSPHSNLFQRQWPLQRTNRKSVTIFKTRLATPIRVQHSTDWVKNWLARSNSLSSIEAIKISGQVKKY